jgi:hypothetical protein
MPCYLLKLVFGGLHALVSDDEENGCQKCLRKMLFMIIVPYEKFILRMDENAFTLVYLARFDLCKASKKDFYLRRRADDSITDSITLIEYVYNFLGKIAISGLATGCSLVAFNYIKSLQGDVMNLFVPAIVNPLIIL